MGLGRGRAGRLVDDLRRLDESRSTFVTIASHELRTPISAVYRIGAPSCAYLGEDQVRLLHDELFQQATRLRRLADQLLDHSRLDAGGGAPGRKRFHAKDRLDSVLSRMACGRLGRAARRRSRPRASSTRSRSTASSRTCSTTRSTTGSPVEVRVAARRCASSSRTAREASSRPLFRSSSSASLERDRRAATTRGRRPRACDRRAARRGLGGSLDYEARDRAARGSRSSFLGRGAAGAR